MFEWTSCLFDDFFGCRTAVGRAVERRHRRGQQVVEGQGGGVQGRVAAEGYGVAAVGCTVDFGMCTQGEGALIGNVSEGEACQDGDFGGA